MANKSMSYRDVVNSSVQSLHNLHSGSVSNTSNLVSQSVDLFAQNFDSIPPVNESL